MSGMFWWRRHHTKHGFDLRKLTPKSLYMGGGAMGEVCKMSEVSASLPKRCLRPHLVIDWWPVCHSSPSFLGRPQGWQCRCFWKKSIITATESLWKDIEQQRYEIWVVHKDCIVKKLCQLLQNNVEKYWTTKIWSPNCYEIMWISILQHVPR